MLKTVQSCDYDEITHQLLIKKCPTRRWFENHLLDSFPHSPSNTCGIQRLLTHLARILEINWTIWSWPIFLQWIQTIREITTLRVSRGCPKSIPTQPPTQPAKKSQDIPDSQARLRMFRQGIEMILREGSWCLSVVSFTGGLWSLFQFCSNIHTARKIQQH